MAQLNGKEGLVENTRCSLAFGKAERAAGSMRSRSEQGQEYSRLTVATARHCKSNMRIIVENMASVQREWETKTAVWRNAGQWSQLESCEEKPATRLPRGSIVRLES